MKIHPGIVVILVLLCAIAGYGIGIYAKPLYTKFLIQAKIKHCLAQQKQPSTNEGKQLSQNFVGMIAPDLQLCLCIKGTMTDQRLCRVDSTDVDLSKY